MSLIPIISTKKKRRFCLDNETPYYLYIIECKRKNHFYVGITYQPSVREKQHREGRGANFTEDFGVKTFTVLAKLENFDFAYFIEKRYTSYLRRKYPFALTVGGNIFKRNKRKWPKS